MIESGVDVNQTESEHHLTALHVIVDAEFSGQSLRVIKPFIYIIFSFDSMVSKIYINSKRIEQNWSDY